MSQPRKRATIKMHRGFQETKELHSVTLDQMPIAAMITRLDGTIVYANPRFIDQLGMDIDNLGKSVTDFYANQQERQAILNALQQDGHIDDYELQAQRSDGSLVWISISARMVKYEGELAILSSMIDVTERKIAEETLRESKDRFSILSSVTVEGIGISEQGRIVDSNPQLATLLGYETDELIGLNVMDLVAPESRELVMANMRAGVEGPYEHNAIRKDGSIFPVEIRARSIPYKGRTARVSIIRDITGRRQTDANLARRVERLRALHTIEQAVTSSMDLNTILGLLVREMIDQLHVDAASVLLLNPQNQRLDFAAKQGFRTDALQFTSLEIGAGLAGRAAQEHKIVYIENLAEMADNPILLQSIAEEGFVTYYGIPLMAKERLCGVLEVFHRSALHPDPEWLPFLETLGGQAAISIDNARLLELTQTQLRETEALYRVNQGLVASIDPGRLMNDVVDLLQKNFGYFYVQIFVREPETGDFVVRAGSGTIGKQLIQQGYRLAAGEGIIGYTAETGTPFFTNDVDNVFAFTRIPLLPNTKSELAVPIKTAESFLGLLDVHQAPPALLTQGDVRLVSAVADQLAVALQQAQFYADLQDSLRQERATRSQLIHSEKLAVAGRLLASVAHELNNPLQAIQNALFLLKDEEGISTQGKQDLDIVLSEAERMGAMLERLRVTYQPARTEDFQPVQINAVIEDVRTLVATHLRHAQISFESHLDPGLPIIPGVADQLRQVFLNLFMNAVDAMETGGRLTVSTQNLPENNEVLVSVSDTGTGIDPAILPHIFEPFTTGKEKGTGLGLSISYELVFNHGGRIQAENNPEGGAAFRVWLPVGNGGGR